MKIKILNVYEKRLPKALRKLILSYFNKKEFILKSMNYQENLDRQKSLFKWADIVFMTPGRFLKDEVIASGKNIKLIQIWSSGFEKMNLKAIKKYNIPLSNNGSLNSVSVAEHTVLLILSVLRKLPENHLRTVEGNWKGNSHGIDMYNLCNKKVGIVGFGNIGKKVGKICHGFGSKIYYYDIINNLHNNLDYKATYLSIEKIFKSMDIVTVHMHFRNNIKPIINKDLLKLMKKNSVIINVSRAGLIDNKYLYYILKKKKIHGGGFDVYEKEPTSKYDNFIKLKNIVATPHVAGSTLDTYKEVLSNCLLNIKNAIYDSKKVKWRINEIL